MRRMYLITGAAGHLAGALLRALSGRDCAVRGLLLPGESAQDTAQVAYYHGDVTKSETLEAFFSGTEGYEVVVIHTAGLISIARDVTPALYAVNVGGTRNVVEACIRHRVHRLVYVSSVHAIPGRPRGEIITEVAHFSGDAVDGAYAKTKAEASQIVLDAAKAGLDAVIVHPSGILGPYDDGHNHIVQLVKSYLCGKLPAGVTGGYDFVDVRDVAEGCLAAAENGRAGQCYILSNRYCSVKSLLEYVRRLTHGKKKVCVPAWMAEMAAPVVEWLGRMRGQRPLFTRYALRTISSRDRFSHGKATRELRYHPRDLRVTVADTVRWLMAGRFGA